MSADIVNLIRSSVIHRKEDTPLLLLADALDEAHPKNRDGRAEILRRWVNNGGGDGTIWDWALPHTEFFRDPNRESKEYNHAEITHTPHRWTYGPAFQVKLSVPASQLEPHQTTSRFIHYEPTTQEEARELTDLLPNAEQVHNYFDQHFGPDPRPKSPEQFAASINKALQ